MRATASGRQALLGPALILTAAVVSIISSLGAGRGGERLPVGRSDQGAEGVVLRLGRLVRGDCAAIFGGEHDHSQRRDGMSSRTDGSS